jgi:hypothetical protein
MPENVGLDMRTARPQLILDGWSRPRRSAAAWRHRPGTIPRRTVTSSPAPACAFEAPISTSMKSILENGGLLHLAMQKHQRRLNVYAGFLTVESEGFSV